MDIRAEYVRDRVAFVDGARMTSILRGLGATEQDVERLRLVSDRLTGDPTLPFRKTRNGRFCLDPDVPEVFRLEFQPFVLSSEDDFVRHDSEQARVFEEIDDDLQSNTALQALFAAKSLIIQDVPIAHRPKLDYDSRRWICTLFSIRTETNATLLGEPALEGVHCDGVDHTMTTFLGSDNMTEDSAMTFIHDMREVNARRWNEVDPELLIGKGHHRDFLDTLLIVDHERKHSVSPVYAVDGSRPATRDMLIFFTRKPVVPGHISYPFDSLVRHRGLPMSAVLPALPVAVSS